MTTYKKTAIVKDPGQLVLSGLPFKPGQRVEVVISDAPSESTSDALLELQALFAETQSLPSSQTITEEEITAEIDAYRRGQ